MYFCHFSDAVADRNTHVLDAPSVVAVTGAMSFEPRMKESLDQLEAQLNVSSDGMTPPHAQHIVALVKSASSLVPHREG